MDRIGSLLIDWLGCCSALESCVGRVGGFLEVSSAWLSME